MATRWPTARAGKGRLEDGRESAGRPMATRCARCGWRRAAHGRSGGEVRTVAPGDRCAPERRGVVCGKSAGVSGSWTESGGSLGKHRESAEGLGKHRGVSGRSGEASRVRRENRRDQPTIAPTQRSRTRTSPRKWCATRRPPTHRVCARPRGAQHVAIVGRSLRVDGASDACTLAKRTTLAMPKCSGRHARSRTTRPRLRHACALCASRGDRWPRGETTRHVGARWPTCEGAKVAEMHGSSPCLGDSFGPREQRRD